MQATRPLEPTDLPRLPLDDDEWLRADPAPWRPGRTALALLTAALVLAAVLLG